VLNELHAAGELELLADESQVFADHLKNAAEEVAWVGKDPAKSIGWESVRSAPCWTSIEAAVEQLDLADRPTGLSTGVTIDNLTPDYDLAVGLLRLLQTIENNSPSDAKALLNSLAPPKNQKKKSGAKISLADRLKITADQPVSAADIALFGRMTTSDAFRDVEAACQMADAISTHPVDIETDTAAQFDFGRGQAAEHRDKLSHRVS